MRKPAEGGTDSKKAGDQAKYPAARPKAKAPESAEKKTWFEAIKGGAEQGAEAHITVACEEGTQLFVDGVEKGKLVKTGLTVPVSPGKHKIIVTSKSGALYTQNVDLEPGKTVHLKPGFCD